MSVAFQREFNCDNHQFSNLYSSIRTDHMGGGYIIPTTQNYEWVQAVDNTGDSAVWNKACPASSSNLNTEENIEVDPTELAMDEARDKFKNKEYKAAFNIYKRLAENGYHPAQYKIAVMYEMGMGVEKNKLEASRWYDASKLWYQSLHR